MKKLILASLILALVAIVAPINAAPVKARTVTISYNAALSLHEAAMPARYRVGSKYRITYKGKSVTVRAIYGGCTCLDISDEAMNRLASTGQGVIKALVEPR